MTKTIFIQSEKFPEAVPADRSLIDRLKSCLGRKKSSMYHEQVSLCSTSKDVALVFHDRKLTDAQKNIIGNYIRQRPLMDDDVLLFDPRDIDDNYSIDFIHNILPRMLLMRAADFDCKQFIRKSNVSSPKPMRMPLEDLWEVVFAGEDHFQYTILVTELCNLNCVMCPFHSQDDEWIFKKIRPAGIKKIHLSMDNLIKYLDSIPEKQGIRLGANGEPFLHPDIFRIISILKQRKHEVYIQTNGNLLDQDKLDKLASLDVNQLNFGIEGIRPEVYSSCRVGGKLDKVLDIMKKCMNMKKNGTAKWEITINYTLLPKLKDSTKDIAVFFKGYAERINFAMAFIDPYCEHTFEHKITDIKDLPQLCFIPAQCVVLGPTGLVFPCGLMSNAEWFEKMPWIENVNDRPLKDITKKYIDMLRDPESDMRRTICKKCTFWAASYRKKGTLTDAYYHSEIL